MANTSAKMIARLKKAISHKFPNEHLLYSSVQTWSEDEKRPITQYLVKQAVDGNYMGKVIFSTYSQLHLLFYLRDYWLKLNGQPIPTNNSAWEEAKVKYQERKQPHPHQKQKTK